MNNIWWCRSYFVSFMFVSLIFLVFTWKHSSFLLNILSLKKKIRVGQLAHVKAGLKFYNPHIRRVELAQPNYMHWPTSSSWTGPTNLTSLLDTWTYKDDDVTCQVAIFNSFWISFSHLAFLLKIIYHFPFSPYNLDSSIKPSTPTSLHQ